MDPGIAAIEQRTLQPTAEPRRASASTTAARLQDRR
jgi:hypothetical protein